MTSLHRAPNETTLAWALDLLSPAIHYEHPRGFVAVSRTDPRIRRHCCDNCYGHHWGYFTGSWRDGDLDFEYRRPDGGYYLCPAGHALDGTERCLGPCQRCASEARA